MSIISHLYNVYYKIEAKSSFLRKIKYFEAQRFVVRRLVNILLPFYYRFTCNNPDYSLGKCDKKSGRIIVSFTSFPKRINKVWFVVERILRQTLKPDKLILWLSKEQFPTLDFLPKKLLNQQKRGLEIVLVEGNIRSHKKYYYAIKEYPEDYIITIDDDIIYKTNLIQNLVEAEKKNPGCICSGARELPTYKNGILQPYNKWFINCYKEWSKKNEFLDANPGKKYFFLTGIGTIYPPHSLYEDICNIELALKLCPLADDVWLNTMARLKGTNVIFVPGFDRYREVDFSNNVKLWSVNGWLGLNDIQIEFTRKYYTEKLGIDPFKEEAHSK